MSVYEQADELVRTEHRVETSPFGWGCECGKGTTWPLAPVNRAKAAAGAHLRSEWHRAVRELRGAAR